MKAQVQDVAIPGKDILLKPERWQEVKHRYTSDENFAHTWQGLIALFYLT